MKYLILILLFMLSVSCTKKTPAPPAPESKDVVAESDKIPAIEIDINDRACEVDSDCERVATNCSCGCGQGVHKKYIQKYDDRLNELCVNYRGKMCKILCNGKTTCKNKLCTYEY